MSALFHWILILDKHETIADYDTINQDKTRNLFACNAKSSFKSMQSENNITVLNKTAKHIPKQNHIHFKNYF